MKNEERKIKKEKKMHMVWGDKVFKICNLLLFLTRYANLDIFEELKCSN